MNFKDRFSLGAVTTCHIRFERIIRRKIIKLRYESNPGRYSIGKKTVRIPASSTPYIPKYVNEKVISTRRQFLLEIRESFLRNDFINLKNATIIVTIRQ